MLDKNGSILQALVKLVDIYGLEYIKAHKNAPCCFSEGDGTNIVSFMFESKNDRPELMSDHLGWAVYATVEVNPTTTECIITDGRKQDGTAIA